MIFYDTDPSEGHWIIHSDGTTELKEHDVTLISLGETDTGWVSFCCICRDGGSSLFSRNKDNIKELCYDHLRESHNYSLDVIYPRKDDKWQIGQ